MKLIMETTMTTYTIERVLTYKDDLRLFLECEMPELSKRFGNKFNHEMAIVKYMIEKGIVFVGKRNGEIRGLHISWLYKSPLDITVKILHQQLFYVKPDSGRMSFHLFNKFIDFGKSEANHIITMLTSETNIKSETLNKYGFKELETLYRMEIK